MLFHIYLWLSAAIFNLPLTLTINSILTIPVVLPDPENISVAIADSLQYGVSAEMKVVQCWELSLWIFHAIFSTIPYG